jgi:hypothetical protein
MSVLNMLALMGVGVDEIAAVSEAAETLLEESSAIFGLVFTVLLLILFEFMKSMGKFALVVIGAVTVLNKFFAELRLLFITFGIVI